MTSPARKSYRRIKIVGPDKPGWAASVIDMETGEEIPNIEKLTFVMLPGEWTMAEMHLVDIDKGTLHRSMQRVHDVQLDVIARQYIEDEEG